MVMKIWASLDDHVMPTKAVGVVGRNVANHRFLRALLRHGSFDEYWFFLSNASHIRHFESQQGEWIRKLGVADKVRVFDIVDLPAQVAGQQGLVFHQSDHVNRFNALCRVRNRLGAGFPVTAFIHSISYHDYMSRYLELAHTGATIGDAIICSSQAGRQALRNGFAQIEQGLAVSKPQVRLEQVPLGLEDDMTALDRAAMRQAAGIRPDEVVALCFGRFSDFDKMDLFPLVQAFRRLQASQRPWRLILAGATHSPDYLEMVQLWTRLLQVDNKIMFLPDTSEADKAALFSMSDFFVSVADNPQETFGLTLLEALRAGLPLLVSDWNGYREIATDDVALRVPTAWVRHEALEALHPIMDDLSFHRYVAQATVVDVAGLATGLERMFQDAGLRATLGQAARHRFLTIYDYRLVIQRLERIWDELVQGFARQAPVPDALCMDLGSQFAHYPSRVLQGQERVRTSARGLDLLAAGDTQPLLPGMEVMVSQLEVARLLQAAVGGVTLAELWADDNASTGKRRYISLWMLKQDLLELLPTDPG